MVIPYPHDPYLYAFLRAFGLPGTYYKAYLAELTPPHLRRRKTPPPEPATPIPTPQHPAQLDWVTPTHISLARAYLKDTTAARITARNIDTAKQHLLDALTSRKQAGARRTLLHAQAKHLAALVRVWDETNSGLIDADNYKKLIAHAVPIELSALDDYKISTQQELYRQRAQRQTHARKLNLASAAWEDAKVRYGEARRVYHAARARWYKVRREAEIDRATRRMTKGNFLAHVSADMLATCRTAQRAYQDALKARNSLRLEWRACKTRMCRLNKVGTS